MNTHFEYAGFFRRCGAILYDTLIILAFLLIGTLILLPFTGGQAIEPQNFIYQIYLLAIELGYFVAFWVHGGQTLGMRAWRIRVQTLNGKRLSWSQGITRLCWATVTVLPLGLGLWWALFNPERQTLYDRLAKTQVVMVK
jgi:uncharacterized RDD family membrane protein YckC